MYDIKLFYCIEITIVIHAVPALKTGCYDINAMYAIGMPSNLLLIHLK